MAESPTSTQKFPKILGRQERAAVLLAEDELTDEVIAASVGVTRRALTKWKQQPQFQALVSDHVGRIQASALKFPIAKKHKRVAVLDEMHTRSLQVIHDRAERYSGRIEAGESAMEAARRTFGAGVPAEAARG